jgi:ATP-dependent Clp protease protease subunit
MLSEATGQPFSKIENDTERDTWFSAEQALEYGIIDKIIHSNKEIDK